MKKDIHPQVNNQVTVTCVCGNTFVTQSTLDEITVEICSNCHPFYTGQQKFIDTEGRIDKFEKKRKLAEAKKEKEQERQAKKAKKNDSQEPEVKPSLKEMLQAAASDNQ